VPLQIRQEALIGYDSSHRLLEKLRSLRGIEDSPVQLELWKIPRQAVEVEHRGDTQ
jgi:hypothetical protein